MLILSFKRQREKDLNGETSQRFSIIYAKKYTFNKNGNIDAMMDDLDEVSIILKEPISYSRFAEALHSLAENFKNLDEEPMDEIKP